MFWDIFGSVRGSEIPLGQRVVQRYLWVSEWYRDIFGSVKGSEISVGYLGVQRYLWINEGCRDIFGSARGSEISLGQRVVQRHLRVSERYRDIFGSARGSEIPFEFHETPPGYPECSITHVYASYLCKYDFGRHQLRDKWWSEICPPLLPGRGEMMADCQGAGEWGFKMEIVMELERLVEFRPANLLWGASDHSLAVYL